METLWIVHIFAVETLMSFVEGPNFHQSRRSEILAQAPSAEWNCWWMCLKNSIVYYIHYNQCVYIYIYIYMIYVIYIILTATLTYFFLPHWPSCGIDMESCCADKYPTYVHSIPHSCIRFARCVCTFNECMQCILKHLLLIYSLSPSIHLYHIYVYIHQIEI